MRLKKKEIGKESGGPKERDIVRYTMKVNRGPSQSTFICCTDSSVPNRGGDLIIHFMGFFDLTNFSINVFYQKKKNKRVWITICMRRKRESDNENNETIE